jgi:hypothetical protein
MIPFLHIRILVGSCSVCWQSEKALGGGFLVDSDTLLLFVSFEAALEDASPLLLKAAQESPAPVMKKALVHVHLKTAVTAPLAHGQGVAASSVASSVAWVASLAAAPVTVLVLAALLFSLEVLLGVSSEGGTKQQRPSEHKVGAPTNNRFMPVTPTSIPPHK